MAGDSDLDFGATVRGLAPELRCFGRFQLTRILGRGGMGVVWLAHDDELQLDVALKFLPAGVGADEAAVADLRQETRRARELAHLHIVRVYDFHRNGTLAAVSMEYVDGGTLTNLRLLQAQRIFEPIQLQTWIAQLAGALDFAHRRAKVVHRDLKPANLMVGANGDLKITDFGISASVSDSVTRVSQLSASSGSPPYMSPQQMAGGRPAASDDIYAVGATIYELVTGRPPFYSGNIPYQVMDVVPPSMALRRSELGVVGEPIPAAWEEGVAAALAKDAARRPASAGEFLRRLESPPLGDAVTVMSRPVDVGEAPTVVRRPQSAGPTLAEDAPLTAQTEMPSPKLTTSAGKPFADAGAPQPADPPHREATPAPAASSKPRKSRVAWWAVSAGSVVAVAAFLLFRPASHPAPAPVISEPVAVVPAESTPPVVAAPPATFGTLRLRTNPAGARLAMRGAATGVAPWIEEKVATGKQHVSIGAPGYQTQDIELEIRAGELTDAGLITLVPAKSHLNVTAKAGDVTGRIESITLDGAGLAAVTREGALPLQFDDLPTGAYRVTLRRAGWPDEVQQMMLEAGGTHEATGGFPEGTITISAKADVVGRVERVASVAGGQSTVVREGVLPLQLKAIPAGRYRVTMSRAGWPDESQELDLADGEELAATGRFPEARLTFSSDPPGATILLDDRDLGVAPPEIVVPTGEHVVRARFRDWPELTQPITATNGARQAIALTFPAGGLEIRSNVAGASYEMKRDGAVVESGSLPSARLNLHAATYEVVSGPVGIRMAAKQAVVVGGGRDTVLDLRLQPDRKAILLRADRILGSADIKDPDKRLSLETELAYAWARLGDRAASGRWLRVAASHTDANSAEYKAKRLLVVAAALEETDLQRSVTQRLKLKPTDNPDPMEFRVWRALLGDTPLADQKIGSIYPGTLLRQLVNEGAVSEAATLVFSDEKGWTYYPEDVAQLAWELKRIGRLDEAKHAAEIATLKFWENRAENLSAKDPIQSWWTCTGDAAQTIAYLRWSGLDAAAEGLARGLEDSLTKYGRAVRKAYSRRTYNEFFRAVAVQRIAAIRTIVSGPQRLQETLLEFHATESDRPGEASYVIVDEIIAWRRLIDGRDPAEVLRGIPPVHSDLAKGPDLGWSTGAYLELGFADRIEEALAIAESAEDPADRVARIIDLSLFGLREDKYRDGK